MTESFLSEFSDDAIQLQEVQQIRPKCSRCLRPTSVCLCACLPVERVELQRTRLLILQHPNEEKRPLNTVAIMKACLAPHSCTVYRGKKFAPHRYSNLHEMLLQGNTYVVYPHECAIELEQVAPGNVCNLVLLDGTWKQAAAIYAQNKVLHKLPKVKIKVNVVSEYVIRTQPTDDCLSTIECAAIALRHTENDHNIGEIFLKPLRELCHIQLRNGASVHHSKEFIERSTVK